MAGMQPNDVYELVNAGDPRISPDGTRVAYTVTEVDPEANDYRGAIWVASLDGSSEPRRFTSGERRDTTPRWSPDGKWLAFASNRGGEADAKTPSNLYLIPAEGGEARKLTDLKEAVEAIVWSPDSTRIAYTTRVRDEAYQEEDEKRRAPRRFTRIFHKLDSIGFTGDRRKQVFIVGLDDGESRQLTSGDFEHDNPAWSPDGKQLAFDGMRDENWDTQLINRLYLVDAAGGEPKALTGDEGSYEQPAFSPDGSRIAYRMTVEDGTYPHHTQLGVMSADGSGAKLLTTSLDRQCGPYPERREPLWDGDRLLFSIEDGGNIHLYTVPSDGSAEPELLVGGEQTIGSCDILDGKLVYLASTHRTMREVYVGTEGKRLTDVGRSFTEGRDLGEPERFTAVSADGYEVDAWAVRPPGFEQGKRYPAILTIHGGPFTQYGTGFFDEFQVMAAGGYVVLFSNPRGGSGYSEAHGRAIRGPVNEAGPGWGSVDYDDVMAVVDTALETFDFIDPDRLGVIGGSYGGYMTSWIIGHNKRFKAAISERAVNNLVSMFGSSDLFWVFERQFGGPLWENVDAYLEKSPSTYAHDIETPVLVLHSEQDLRCNIEQGEHLFTLLHLLGKDVEMLRFPAESHELTRAGSPIHRVTRFEAVLEWFGRYLSPGG